ncbi:MAG: hypothetical protein AB2L14_25265 [Candidatus Xenobiia bacterium LiM19]
MRQLTFGKVSTGGGNMSKPVTPVGCEESQTCPSQDYDYGYQGQGCVIIKMGDTGQTTFNLGGGYYVP